MEASFTCTVHINDTVDAVNFRSCREVGSFDVLHVLFKRHTWHSRTFFSLLKDALNVKADCPRNFREVVRRDTSCHTNRNTIRTVEKKVWKSCRQDCGFHFGIIKIWLEIDCLLFDVFQHMLGNTIKSALRISHSCWRVTVD